ncbi:MULTISPECIES: hypothetical protein [Legionella]|uniref:Uncharacterized protein n=1 Tax=Legionella septentrionalis TaxID=2498109 RepID=A0A433JLT6_9GAMM|nr:MULTISPECIES: hypothetical protein [Legionella]MCP0914051.1 hypothetical protein [Legionella sp. 27cVA30]RUQ90787.1 hypothetical protein EKM59_01580 [Legionella septentrionalis]RUQ95019.1 hypothetical protein ELY11_10280 [Legionella septentrionalis]RUR09195.1 hypothetical protein ELY14_09400 [Legionella septentrionalis]RUR13944.1 hypothetical protein ELY10_09660 [Legionella septentrionalis]
MTDIRVNILKMQDTLDKSEFVIVFENEQKHSVKLIKSYSHLLDPKSGPEAIAFASCAVMGHADQYYFLQNLCEYLVFMSRYSKSKQLAIEAAQQLDAAKKSYTELTEQIHGLFLESKELEDDKSELAMDEVEKEQEAWEENYKRALQECHDDYQRKRSLLEQDYLFYHQDAFTAFKHSLGMLEDLWKNCILTDGDFYLNLTAAFFSGEDFGFANTGKEGKEKLEKLTKQINDLVSKFRGKEFKQTFKTSGMIPDEKDMEILNSMIENESIVDEANAFFSKILINTLGMEGISQAKTWSKVFAQSLQKWTVEHEKLKEESKKIQEKNHKKEKNETEEKSQPQVLLPSLPRWSREEERAFKQFERIGKLVCKWSPEEAVKAQLEKSKISTNEKNNGGFYTPRPNASVLTSPKQLGSMTPRTHQVLVSPLRQGGSSSKETMTSVTTSKQSTPKESSTLKKTLSSFFSFGTHKEPTPKLSKKMANLQNLAFLLIKVTYPPLPEEVESLKKVVDGIRHLKGEVYDGLKESLEEIIGASGALQPSSSQNKETKSMTPGNTPHTPGLFKLLSKTPTRTSEQASTPEFKLK